MNQFIKGMLTVTLLFLLPITCFAYIDPGTSSFILQIIFATAIGAGITIKTYYQRIKQTMKRLFSSNVEATPPTDSLNSYQKENNKDPIQK